MNGMSSQTGLLKQDKPQELFRGGASIVHHVSIKVFVSGWINMYSLSFGQASQICSYTIITAVKRRMPCAAAGDDSSFSRLRKNSCSSLVWYPSSQSECPYRLARIPNTQRTRLQLCLDLEVVQ
jgi:hypothetical protein